MRIAPERRRAGGAKDSSDSECHAVCAIGPSMSPLGTSQLAINGTRSCRAALVTLVGLLLSAGLAAACGGQAIVSAGTGGAESGSAGGGLGDAASAGNSARGGATCKQVCPTVQCVSGYHVETAPGQCCPACVVNPAGQACNDGQIAYSAFMGATLTKYQSLACRVDSDCVAVNIINDCQISCGALAVLGSQQKAMVSSLDQAASMDCATCAARDSSCPLPGAATCINAQCWTLGSTLPP